ncbi:MAG: hypothetical protein MHM6MM_003315 [Cercozoa sp. M6MM]
MSNFLQHTLPEFVHLKKDIAALTVISNESDANDTHDTTGDQDLTGSDFRERELKIHDAVVFLTVLARKLTVSLVEEYYVREQSNPSSSTSANESALEELDQSAADRRMIALVQAIVAILYQPQLLKFEMQAREKLLQLEKVEWEMLRDDICLACRPEAAGWPQCTICLRHIDISSPEQTTGNVCKNRHEFHPACFDALKTVCESIALMDASTEANLAKESREWRSALRPHSRRRVLVVSTGGTYSMSPDPQTGSLRPQKNYLRRNLPRLDEMQHHSMPEVSMTEFNPPIDSSNLLPPHWMRIARTVYDNYNDFDGFVVLHGTDTMAYTAAALSFLLVNLAKPVVLTGAQVPMDEVYNDARRNLLVSLLVAANLHIPEVCIFFHETLLRGNRATKSSPWAASAFSSPNYPPLARMGITVDVNERMLLPLPRRRFALRVGCLCSLKRCICSALPPPTPIEAEAPATEPDTLTESHARCKVTLIRLAPGSDSASLISAYARDHTDAKPHAIVLQVFGAGNMPENDAELVQALRDAAAAGVVVVVLSQCHAGFVAPGLYAASQLQFDIGAINGKDLTVEAAYTKLFVLLSAGFRGSALRRAFESSLAGESTHTQTHDYYTSML